MSYKLPKITFKNDEHKNFANIYARACNIICNSCYHDDSGVWYCTSQRFVKKNNDFTLIYQPKKGFDEYETGEIAMLIKKNNGKFNKKYISEIKYILDYIDFLVCKSFNIILEISNNKWFEEITPTDFNSIMQITKPISIKDNGIISFNFIIRGFEGGITHIEWNPFLCSLFIKDKLDNKNIIDTKKNIIDDEDYKYCEKNVTPINIQNIYSHLFKGTKRKRSENI